MKVKPIVIQFTQVCIKTLLSSYNTTGYKLLLTGCLICWLCSCCSGHDNSTQSARLSDSDSLNSIHSEYNPPTTDSLTELADAQKFTRYYDDCILVRKTIDFENQKYILEEYETWEESYSFKITCYEGKEIAYSLLRTTFRYPDDTEIPFSIIIESAHNELNMVSLPNDTLSAEHLGLSYIRDVLKNRYKLPKVKLNENGVITPMRDKRWYGEFKIDIHSSTMHIRSVDYPDFDLPIHIYIPYVSQTACNYILSDIQSHLPPFKITQLDKFGIYFISTNPLRTPRDGGLPYG